MPLLGDEQASGIRRMLLSSGEFCGIEAFPQKDNPARRVFADAKLSTTLFVFQKNATPPERERTFSSRVHPAQFIQTDPPTLSLTASSIDIYDPSNLTIVSCTQDDWDLMASLPTDKIARLRDYAEFFQGEVNQTNATAKGQLTDESQGVLVTRGASISLYQHRDASQGEDIYLDVEKFLDSRERSSKAFHHEYERVGLQESSPQNNFRRIIACRILKDNFCNHTVNYTTNHHCRVELSLALFILNSSFSDWYFRLGSTNAHVSQYQLLNLPCPRFSTDQEIDPASAKSILKLAEAGEFDSVEQECLRLATNEGCSPRLEAVIIELVRFIEREEEARGEITRTQRSALAESSSKCQGVLDKLILELLGLGANKHAYLRA